MKKSGCNRHCKVLRKNWVYTINAHHSIMFSCNIKFDLSGILLGYEEIRMK